MEMQLHDTGAAFGIVVKLANPDQMACPTFNTYHTKPDHRIWMDGEFEILSEQQVLELKKLWKVR